MTQTQQAQQAQQAQQTWIRFRSPRGGVSVGPVDA